MKPNRTGLVKWLPFLLTAPFAGWLAISGIPLQPGSYLIYVLLFFVISASLIEIPVFFTEQDIYVFHWGYIDASRKKDRVIGTVFNLLFVILFGDMLVYGLLFWH